MPLHLIKLAVGAKTIDDVRTWQIHRAKVAPPLRHRTRNFPRRADEIIDGGSIYWVVNRLLCLRQTVRDIVEAKRDDGTRCTDLILDPALVVVEARMMKPFQGWRYLAAADAPADVRGTMVTDLPESLRRELAALALL